MNLYDEILHILQQHAQMQQEVGFINEYKGVPVANRAQIVSCEGPEVTFKTGPEQLVCMHLEQQVYIASDRLPSVVRAGVADLNFAAGLARLSHFAYTNETIGKRICVRVHPETAIPVVIASKNRKLMGNLADISETGLGVYTLGAYLFNIGVLQRDSVVRLTLQLSPGEPDIILNGTINNIAKEQDSFRLGIIISPDEATRSQISAFVTERQEEILDELHQLYQELSSRR